jgi:ankyrin repeat protein
MHATERNDRAMVEALLELGLDPADGDANGVTAVTLAQRNDNAPLAALLSGARSPH